MTKGRLEAFSDGVIAIIITIMVLELKAPHAADWDAVRPLVPTFSTYVLSYVLVGIYWNNHHHMLHATERVNGTILWANLHLLFWLSLVPFTTAWMGENHFASLPTAAYAVVLFMSGVAYYILSRAILAHHGESAAIRRAVGNDAKARISTVLYAAAIPLAFVERWVSFGIFVVVALMWLVPDRRIEREIDDRA
jgi:uncharacterized membrane protein